MLTIRNGVIALWMLICLVVSAEAQVSIGIGLPNVSIGINLPLFPELVRVPGYPVYYAPRVDANYFFYDGMYWVYQNDNWYTSSWYNGPWWLVEPQVVPLFILRVPVHYYRQPPVYFRGWHANAPPRWGSHWGHEWERHRSGWDRWKRSSAPPPAPLPVYQRQYSGDRYPKVEQQHTLRSKQYRYQPRDKIVRQHFKQTEAQIKPAPAQRVKKEESVIRTPEKQDITRPTPVQKAAPRPQTPHQAGEKIQKSAPVSTPQQRQDPAVHDEKQQKKPAQREQPSHRSAPQERKQVEHDQKQQPAASQPEHKAPRVQDRGQKPSEKRDSQEPRRDRGQGEKRDEERGRERNN